MFELCHDLPHIIFVHLKDNFAKKSKRPVCHKDTIWYHVKLLNYIVSLNKRHQSQHSCKLKVSKKCENHNKCGHFDSYSKKREESRSVLWAANILDQVSVTGFGDR